MHSALTTVHPARSVPRSLERPRRGPAHDVGPAIGRHDDQPTPGVRSDSVRLAEGGFRFWACARGLGGRARTTAVWGLWLDHSVVFAADTESIAAGDPPAFPASLVQVEDDGEVKVVDGSAARVDDPALLARFVSACEAKYGFEPDPGDPDTPVYAFRPSQLDQELDGRT